MGNNPTIYQRLWFFSQMCYLFPLSLAIVLPNIIIGAMPKSLKSNKFIGILNIPMLLDIPPCLIMIILDNWRIIRLLNILSFYFIDKLVCSMFDLFCCIDLHFYHYDNAMYINAWATTSYSSHPASWCFIGVWHPPDICKYCTFTN